MKTMKKIATATEKARADDDSVCKSSVARPVKKVKKQTAPPMKLSQNPKSVIKKLKKPHDEFCMSVSTRPLEITKKKQQPLEVSGNPKVVPAVMKKNDTETLELFEIAKKSADVASTKGLLAAKAETSICVDTLSLLIGLPISATAPETRRIMERLAHLTRHKNRKICTSASALFHHWSQSIRDQQH